MNEFEMKIFKKVISHQILKITFLESLMNLKHERSTLKFYDFGIALKEF